MEETKVTFSSAEAEKILRANPNTKFTRVNGDQIESISIGNTHGYIVWGDTWGNSSHVCQPGQIPDGEWTMEATHGAT
jgi:hypothetical protein